MKILSPTIRKTSDVARDTLHALSHTDSRLILVNTALFLTVTATAFTAFLVTETGAAILDELHRRHRLRIPRPESPSLRGTPTPQELAAACAATPRKLLERLRLGSLLADLDPTLDRTIARRTLRNGKTVIRSNPGGIKQWLSDRRVAVPYSTVMRYKKTAQRLRLLLALDDRIPLEWVMDGLPGDRALPTGLDAAFGTARRHLAALLRENRSLAALVRTVEGKLGIMRLVAVRKAPARRRRGFGKARKSKGFSGISQGRSANATPERTEATKEAIRRVLEAENLAGAALHLQNRLRHWVSTLAPPRG